MLELDNPLQTRDDLVCAARAFLRPLIPYFSPGRARVRIPCATAAHFDETAAELEGFARPLWAVSALLLGDGDAADLQLVQPWLDGFETGPDPDHPEYWGDIEDYDQRMVEVEMISVALLAIPQRLLWQPLSERAKRNLVTWLSGILDHKVHPANWLWFRVFACLALLKTCGIDTPKLRAIMKTDLEILDTFYMSDGWSSDGLWRAPGIDDEEFKVYGLTGKANAIHQGRSACYYSGSFAIQFSQLLYTRFAADLEPTRTERYREQARLFGNNFCHYFDAGGAAIPFGRSLVYRFACGGFFAALAVAKVSGMPSCLGTAGAVKGFLLRHLRWWSRYSEKIHHADGTMNLGWTYPQMYLTENYNSPQSVYWALKTFFCLALGADDEFWNAAEDPFPQPTSKVHDTTHHALEAIKLAGPHGQITCNHPAGNHHFLLNCAQFVTVPFKGVQAKYGKFAYSSAFGFSVPSGAHGLGQVVPDNMLALSRDGTQTWAVKYRCGSPRYSYASVNGPGQSPEIQQVLIATVEWWPWADRQVAVHTTLIPPTDRWPDWHVRIHRIKISPDATWSSNSGGHDARLFMAEGGFAIHGQQASNTRPLKRLDLKDLTDDCQVGAVEGVVQTATSVLIASEQGASGLIGDGFLLAEQPAPQATVLDAEPNTNVMRQKTLIPCIESIINTRARGLDKDIVYVTKVFAISAEANAYKGLPAGSKSLRQRWLDFPQVGGIADVLYREEDSYILVPG
ncbi:DUF2264 domain-containing protein [Microdochium nivale]|nr:DUF2264 domain-containing protein [Microdochium nivale]